PQGHKGRPPPATRQEGASFVFTHVGARPVLHRIATGASADPHVSAGIEVADQPIAAFRLILSAPPERYGRCKSPGKEHAPGQAAPVPVKAPLQLQGVFLDAVLPRSRRGGRGEGHGGTVTKPFGLVWACDQKRPHRFTVKAALTVFSVRVSLTA